MKPVVIRVSGLSKCYPIYRQPRDRLKQFVLPRLARFFGRPQRRYYREFWALRDVGFEIRAGETVGIVGRNGSGKSTLLQLLCGTLSPTAGEIQCRGRIAALLELGAGFNPEFTGRENVFLNAAVLGLTREQTEAALGEILAFAEIGEFIDQPVKTYSSGMVVRLAFAVAIHVQPEVLVIDEALSVGDERFQRKCFGRIEAMRRQGVTILFVSHSAGTVVELCDRALLLDAGELITEGEPKRVVASYQKLLYAPAEQVPGIVAALRAGRAQPSGGEGQSSSERSSAHHVAEAETALVADDREVFDPALKPTSTMEFESRGARIERPTVINALGSPVNHLVRGRQYSYRYLVRFDRTCTHVRFGMMLKSLTGIELGGASTTAPGVPTLPIVEAGTEVEVGFDFVCRLAPGVYFLNAGVGADMESEETYIHRVIDAAMFRVVPEERDTLTGMVDFSCKGTAARRPSAESQQVQARPDDEAATEHLHVAR